MRTHTALPITAGVNALERLHELVPEGRVLLVTTPGSTRRGVTARVLTQLGTDRVTVYDRVAPNPELDAIDEAIQELNSRESACVIAIGGGSALDTGKVLGVTLPGKSLHPLHSVLRQGLVREWERRLLVIAVPTTAGTGAEVTPFATVWDGAHHTKHSVAGEKVRPTHALLDPSLTLTLPYTETLYSGLDAISHALESLWNRNRSPASTAFACESLALAVDALPEVLEQPDNLEQRARMQEAGLLAGLAIGETRTAIAHSMSYPLTSYYKVPHGLACSFTLVAIAALLRESEPSFMSPFERLVAKAVRLLETFDLWERVMEFTDYDGLEALVPQMTASDRCANFPLTVDSSTVVEILGRAGLR